MKVLFLSLFLVLSATASGVEYGKKLNDKFLKCETQSLWEVLSDPIQNLFEGFQQFDDFCHVIGENHASYVEVLEESSVSDSQNTTWWQVRVDPTTKKDVQYLWHINKKNTVVGFSFNPRKHPYPSPFKDYKTKTDLGLPFVDEMEVFWGGVTVEANYHSAYKGQTFALDIMIAKDGSTYANEGKELSDYYCFGKTLVAPGAGIVIFAQGDLPDMEIGQMDPDNPMGNGVVIDHKNGEYSFLAHLKSESLMVKVGDEITKGQELGQCGNSGNTSEPHIHYHMQNSPKIFDAGEGLPLYFNNININGEFKERARLKRGDIVQNN